MGSAMASAIDEGSKFSDRNFDAPLADTAAGACGVTAPTGAAPAAIPAGKLKAAIAKLQALTERLNEKPRD
jgi:hypothetical protein